MSANSSGLVPSRMDILDVKAMSQRFRDRTAAVKDRTMPPIAGAERLAFIAQANADYQDFAMIADCEILLKDGVLILTLDLRPKGDIEGLYDE